MKDYKVPYKDLITGDALFRSTAFNAASCLQATCHGVAFESGWWTNMKTGADIRCKDFGKYREPASLLFNVPEKLCLIHSEVSEAMEGFRKNLMDDKLPTRPMLEVELADVVIRCFDLAGGLGLDLAGAIVEKLRFNANRADHKVENRQQEHGKKF